MCATNQDQTTPSDAASDLGSDASSQRDRQPVYSPQEMGSLLLQLYKFLTTLHFDIADLKVPPPEGWPGFTPEACAHFRNDYAIKVLRHLPYFTFNSKAEFHVKSKLLDYTTFTIDQYQNKHQDQDQDEWWSTIDIVDAGWMLPLALGYGSYGRQFFLNVLDGEINEEFIRATVAGPVPLKDWVHELQDAYSRLLLIPCPGRITMDCADVPEREDGRRITEDEFRAQTGDWPTELDVQYVRQVYRDYGWPHAFQREEAFTYMCELLVSIDKEKEWRYWAETIDSGDPNFWSA